MSPLQVFSSSQYGNLSRPLSWYLCSRQVYSWEHLSRNVYIRWAIFSPFLKILYRSLSPGKVAVWRLIMLRFSFVSGLVTTLLFSFLAVRAPLPFYN